MGRALADLRDFTLEDADAEADGAGPLSEIRKIAAPQAVTQEARFHVISHDVLFATPQERCHACDDVLDTDDTDGGGNGRFGIVGRGILLFSRGDERRAEEPKLCPACGAAIGMTMLSRWAIEEEEG